MVTIDGPADFFPSMKKSRATTTGGPLSGGSWTRASTPGESGSRNEAIGELDVAAKPAPLRALLIRSTMPRPQALSLAFETVPPICGLGGRAGAGQLDRTAAAPGGAGAVFSPWALGRLRGPGQASLDMKGTILSELDKRFSRPSRCSVGLTSNCSNILSKSVAFVVSRP